MKRILSVGAVAIAAVTFVASPASAASVQTIYMKANGSDTNNGATTTTAVKTLARCAWRQRPLGGRGPGIQRRPPWPR